LPHSSTTASGITTKGSQIGRPGLRPIRNAISLGGDADTMACIAGGIAEAYWGVPDKIEQRTLRFRDGQLRQVVDEFNQRLKAWKRGGTD